MPASNNQNREQLALRLGQITRLWRAEVDRRLSPHGLTESRWRLLLALSRADRPLWQKELAEIVCVQGPTLVRTLDWLESEGLVERRATSGDKRAKTVHLTAQAKPSLERIQAVVDNVRGAVFEGVDPKDIDICLAMFDRMNNNLNRMDTVKTTDADTT